MDKSVGAPLLLVMSLIVFLCAKTEADPLTTVLFQGFNWESWRSTSPSWYNVLKSKAKDLAEVGITDVWFPPSSQSAADQGYLPTKLYDLNSKYGSLEELKQAVEAFRQNGVRCMADMVINHRCGSKQDDKGKWCIFEGGTDDQKLDWGAWAVPVNDKPDSCGSGNADTGDDFALAPDVDHTNPTVQKELTEWMNWLRSDIGFDAWRFDFAKGYDVALLAMYVQNTNPAFAVGEVWDDFSFGNGQEDRHRQRLVDWVHATGDRSAAFDFTTKFILQQALRNNELWRLRDSNGKPSGMIGLLPEKAVTFIDNHDTGSQQISPFPYDKVLQGYVYILTHPGIPSIGRRTQTFYDHLEDNNFKEGIRNLTAIRKRNNIKANSLCRIIVAETDLYMATIDERVISKIGTRDDIGMYTPSQEFILVTQGQNFAVWEKQPSAAR